MSGGEMPLTAAERTFLALHGEELIVAVFGDDGDYCEDHGGEGSGSASCPGCREVDGLDDDDDDLPF